MNSVEEYARRWAKYEEEDVDTLSEWTKSVRGILKSRVKRLKRSIKTTYPSVFTDPEVIKELDRLHDHYVLVPADKAGNNIVFVCKAHYINCILEELGFNSSTGNPTYTHSSLSQDEILQNHMSVLDTFNIPNKQYEFELPYLYLIPNFIKILANRDTGSSKCSP